MNSIDPHNKCYGLNCDVTHRCLRSIRPEDVAGQYRISFTFPELVNGKCKNFVYINSLKSRISLRRDDGIYELSVFEETTDQKITIVLNDTQMEEILNKETLRAIRQDEYEEEMRKQGKRKQGKWYWGGNTTRNEYM